MEENFLTFQKFNDLELAEGIQQKLQEQSIVSFIENERKFFDPSFANNHLGTDIRLKINPKDFAKAHQILQDFYKSDLDNIDEPYYLFDFTDKELMEIIEKPDEWGYFDYALSQKLLKERGKEISIDLAENLKKERLNVLSKPETPNQIWIYLGYISAIFGGLFGIIIGWTLSNLKKTLPNGQKVYVFEATQRKHGNRILLISMLCLIFWLIIKFTSNND